MNENLLEMQAQLASKRARRQILSIREERLAHEIKELIIWQAKLDQETDELERRIDDERYSAQPWRFFHRIFTR